MRRHITVIFFDLDHTLFDYDAAKERAVRAALAPVLGRYPQVTYEMLRRQYDVAMRQAEAEGKMWGVSYRTPDRFRDTLRLSGIETEDLIPTMAETYWRVFHSQASVFPEAEEVLTRLKPSYRLGLITNGDSGPQRKTLAVSGLAHLLDDDLIIVSGEVGAHKPAPAIYQAALERAKVAPSEALMVGDHPINDIDGAAKAGLGTVWLARNGEPYPEGLTPPDLTVRDLRELLPFLPGSRTSADKDTGRH